MPACCAVLICLATIQHGGQTSTDWLHRNTPSYIFLTGVSALAALGAAELVLAAPWRCEVEAPV